MVMASGFKLVTSCDHGVRSPPLPRYLSASPLLMLLLFFVLSSSIHHHHHPILALAASSSSSANNVIQCRSGWTNLLQTLHPSQINDGYCDFPYDNADEPNTSACSGGMDGMGAEDALTSYFSRTASFHVVPSELSELRTSKDAIDGQRASLMERIADLEREIGDINGGTSKYGVDGSSSCCVMPATN
ncbi:hypothetical protein ACHAWU_008104 [Discostella pseudostelligera]|uniref:Uncharacterized protein n=1 Tax=Discostella pseudostelligera TaxID=259834 RepID=A0ABD3N839_9STRA